MPEGNSGIRKEFETILDHSDQIKFADTQTALKLAEEALAMARSNLGKDDIVRALLKLGSACYIFSHYEDSLEYAQEALSMLDEEERGLQFARALYIIGAVNVQQGNPSEALKYYLKALNEYENIDDARGIGRTLMAIGTAYYNMGIVDEALGYMLQSETQMQKYDEDISFIASLSMNIANVISQTGRKSEALERYKECLETFRQKNNLSSQAVCLFNQTVCNLELNKIEKARDAALECKRVSNLLGNKGAIARANLIEGDVRQVLGDPHGALWNYKYGFGIFKEMGDNHHIYDSLTGLALINKDLGCLTEAEKYLNEARRLAESHGLRKTLSGIYFQLTQVLEEQNRFKEALDCHKSAYEIEKEILGENQRNRIASLHVIHEVEISRQKAEISRLKNVELVKYKDDLEKLVSERTAALRKQIQERQKTEKEKAEIESHLIRSQRISDLARLTGGITHDFNNILTIVMAFSELAQLEENPQIRHEELDKVIEAGHLGAELADQLLSFCRMQPRALTNFDLYDTIKSTFMLLDRLALGNVTIALDVQPDVGTIFGDKTMVTQVIINLCINAGDAMPDGGIVRISAFKIPTKDNSSDDFVQIEVSDQGTGMPPDIVEKIFTPYFTTKAPGKGTGLGLSVVYGIVKQHKGQIEVESEEGKGTTFRIFLPLSKKGIDFSETSELEPASLDGAGEHILLVEDQKEILGMLAEVLRNSGYIVSAASSVEEATRLYSSQSDGFDLAFIDLVLADGSGIELAERILERNPDQRVIFGSGYARKPEDIEFLENNHYKLIKKPYRISELKKEIRKALSPP